MDNCKNCPVSTLNVNMMKLKIHTRFISNSPAYFDICKEEWEQYEKCFDEISPYVAGDNWLDKVTDAGIPCVINLIKQKWNHLIKTVIFSAMCLEAFIYDYAAHNFSDTYAKKYLDNLDFLSKWVIIPKLSTGKDFPRESKAFEDLVRLIKVRNDFVHSKSIPIPKSDNINELKKKIGPRLKKEVEIESHFNRVPPHEIVIEVLTELRKLEEGDDMSTQWWQFEEVKD